MVEFEQEEDEGACYAFQLDSHHLVFLVGQDFYASVCFGQVSQPGFFVGGYCRGRQDSPPKLCREEWAQAKANQKDFGVSEIPLEDSQSSRELSRET